MKKSKTITMKKRNTGRYNPETDYLNQLISINEIKKAESADNHNVHPKMLENLGPQAIKISQKIFNFWIAKKVQIATDLYQ